MGILVVVIDQEHGATFPDAKNERVADDFLIRSQYDDIYTPGIGSESLLNAFRYVWLRNVRYRDLVTIRLLYNDEYFELDQFANHPILNEIFPENIRHVEMILTSQLSIGQAIRAGNKLKMNC